MSAAPQKIESGIRSRVSYEDYTALPGVRASHLKALDHSAQHYLYRLANPKVTKALTLGTASHTAVLEPERFDRQFAIWSRRTDSGSLAPRRGQYWEGFLAENDGKDVITEDEFSLAMTIQKAVRSHAVAAAYLEHGDPEVTMQWVVDGVARKARVDWLTVDASGPVLVGLKTTRDCRHMIFGSQAAKLGYPLQWAWYFDGYVAILGNEPRVVEIVVESEPPHPVAVYSIPPDIIAQGRDEYERLLKQLVECESTGEFPGPHPVEEPLTLPTWYYEQHDDLNELGLE